MKNVSVLAGMQALSLALAAALYPSLSQASAVPLTGHVYYVATNGLNSNPGTQDAPWLTVQRAANSVVPGDTVYVRGGVYNETVDVPTSGSAAIGPITFSSYPGETATLSGKGLLVPAGTTRGVWNLSDRSYITIQGFDVGYYTASSTTETPIGIYISGAGSNISLLNNRVHDIVNTVESCPNGNAFGIEVYGSRAPASINNLTISGNEVDHLRTGCSESLSLTGNVEHWTISNNVVHDNDNIGIAALGFEKAAPNIGSVIYDQARDGVIAGNTVYNISSQTNGAYHPGDFSSDGIYVEGGTRVTVERNLVHHVDIGIELASETLGKLTSEVIARNNLVYLSNSAGISIGGAGSKNGGTLNATIVNNTLFQNDSQGTGSGEFQIQYHASGTVFENNVIYANSNGLLVNFWPSSAQNPGYGNPGTIDHNLYNAAASLDNANWTWLGTSYTDVGSYRNASQNDAATLVADPQFVNTTTLDLHVSTASLVRGAGLVLPATVVGSVDYDGQPRMSNGRIDIGAYQQP
ncbi:right-handed parallel beta-helix repeat-containing protein [Dyella tabacisoli]|uniref:Right-handed parallel beta-helix repeat-containing protein n=1 Tax=Dyella tabacisoli TaxID=2282381 RepID=A0A369UR31_9GAMM|nr:right-handed parallel beta-helix repeat-containing protein [Dyella tabacisoli]RDD82927.1 right-handed parallel beta-helix repeat-containing protein [Dyella tabacisoli]